MNKGTVNIIVLLLALSALAACGTATTRPAGYTADQPILSAADARSMISVEVRELEPLPVEQALAYHSATPSR